MHPLTQTIVQRACDVIVGKEYQIRQALACLLAGGHLLIEDLPGVGKTTLAHVLARLLGLQFNRIQFTSDLLPSDIIGAAIYNRTNGEFVFHPGPIFTQLLLADEINRTTPKTQSALLEAMEEQQVTTEGETRPLPKPFFVIATQNPTYHTGTFPLPESQLDRFMMCLQLGYPDHWAERTVLQGRDRRQLIEELEPSAEPADLLSMQEQVQQVHASDALLDYLQALVERTRNDPSYSVGLSTRASLALLNGARAWAFMEGRRQVVPEDLQAVFPAVVTHRLRDPTAAGPDTGASVARELLDSVAIP
jgi:MoxR-like ATPase